MNLLKSFLKPIWYKTFLFYRLKYGRQKSFAQYSEDLVIQQLLGEVRRFIDIGAHNGITCSNSLYFSLKGAKGLLFEPTKDAFKWMYYLYHRHPKLICINEGISDKEDILEFRVDGLLSFITRTEDKVHTEHNRKYFSETETIEKVIVKPLSYWLKIFPEFNNSDFLSLDVEGHELAVIQGIDFKSFYTKCFIIETHGKVGQKFWLHKNYREIKNILEKHGYESKLISPLNSFWIHNSIYNQVIINDVIHKYQGYLSTSADAFCNS